MTMLKHFLTFVVIVLSYLTMGALDPVPQLHQQKVTEEEMYTRKKLMIWGVYKEK